MAVFGHTANNSFQDGFKKRSRPTKCGMIFTNFELSSPENKGQKSDGNNSVNAERIP
jgi:hypothetical protein